MISQSTLIEIEIGDKESSNNNKDLKKHQVRNYSKDFLRFAVNHKKKLLTDWDIN